MSHKHILLNDKVANIPSLIVKPGDVISVKEKSKKMDCIIDSIKHIKGDIELPWLSLDKAKMSGIFVSLPEREDMKLTFNEQLVVELYSK